MIKVLYDRTVWRWELFGRLQSNSAQVGVYWTSSRTIQLNGIWSSRDIILATTARNTIEFCNINDTHLRYHSKLAYFVLLNVIQVPFVITQLGYLMRRMRMVYKGVIQKKYHSWTNSYFSTIEMPLIEKPIRALRKGHLMGHFKTWTTFRIIYD